MYIHMGADWYDTGMDLAIDREGWVVYNYTR